MSCYVMRFTICHNSSELEQNCTITQPGNSRHNVTYEQHCPSFPGNIAHLAQTFFLKRGVAHSQHFINQQNLRIEMSCDRKSQAHVHAARIMFDRSVDELFDFGESDNLVEFLFDLGVLHAENRPVKENILATGQLGLEARADF